MIKFTMLGSLLGVAVALALPGCEISTCEEGSYCGEGEGHGNASDEHAQCVAYCGRVSVCGGAQAEDFDDCVDACEDRFEVLPDETAELCRCTEWSTCEDVNEGRCSDSGTGGGGGSSAGGSSAGGSSAGGSSAGGSSAGGSSAGGSSAGGSSAGGSSAGGSAAGGSAGAQCPTGGTSSGGSDAGGAGDGEPCTCDCHCTAPQTCVDGYCAG